MAVSLPFKAFKSPELGTYPDLQTWADQFREQSRPADPIEEALIDRIVRIAYRLRDAETKLDNSPADKDSLRVVTEAERAWTRALSDWTRYRKARKSLKPAPKSKSEGEPQPTTPEPEPESGPEPYTPPPSPFPGPTTSPSTPPSPQPTRSSRAPTFSSSSSPPCSKKAAPRRNPPRLPHPQWHPDRGRPPLRRRRPVRHTAHFPHSP
ncbi:MAG TPA: hypothetical protein VFT74_10725 [Isosphaeraceae bacterium]|nr:hypothetical protein [Isosphaeraceae bacterium]